MDNRPLVSVLMTAYNREKYIAEAIESVLASSYTDFELIIVDDGSKDRTVEIARRYESLDPRVRVYVNETNLGDYPNRNKAASYARGKYLKYVDADDLIYYYCLDVMVNYMERFPQAGLGFASKVSDLKAFPICLDPEHAYLEHFFGYGHFDRSPGSVIIKREAFEKCGGFSGKRMIGDYECWLNMARYYPIVKFPFDLYWNRIHDQQESQTPYARKNYQKLRDEVTKAALDHEDCPLSKTQIEEVWKITRKIKRHRKFQILISNTGKVFKRLK